MLIPIPPDRRLRRGAQLLTASSLRPTAATAATAATMVLAGLGWNRGTSSIRGSPRTFGLAIGTWSIIAGFAVLLLWWPLRQRPGIGTVANALLVGAVIDIVLALVHPSHHRTIPALARGARPSRIMPLWEWISRPRRSQPSD